MTYTLENVETALCIWEAMLEMREKLPELNQAWLDLGTSSMRAIAAEMALEADEEWYGIPEDNRDGVMFDWDFIPGVVRRYDWVQHQHMR